jgi:hypothetical protein
MLYANPNGELQHGGAMYCMEHGLYQFNTRGSTSYAGNAEVTIW